MPRQSNITIDNNFRNGLITQATGLNFPENAVTSADNCEFNVDGSVSRRLGLDFENDFVTQNLDRSSAAISTYLWKNVAGDGNVSVVVTQIGNTLYFYRLSLGQPFSQGLIATPISLTPVSGAPDSLATFEVQYSDGNGLLFVTHPYCDPIRISYNITTDVVTSTAITIKIRDLEGATADPHTVSERPTASAGTLNRSHYYNLLNQGWNNTNLAAWDTAQTTMPSNADVMWRFRDSSDDFDASSASIARITAGNTPAPKGHFILTLADQDRNTASGLTGVASTTTSFQRPSISTFFAGRVFYSGINYVGFNSNIYFTQIIERNEQYGACHQQNDPTAEDLFDLLPSDGGVISIPDAGTIYKLVPLSGGLGVFAANGIWFVSGSQGIGFTASDYTIQRIALIPTLSATSFVNVNGLPAWWNAEGIYIIDGGSFGQGSQLPSIKSLTFGTIKDFYDQIPLNSKKYARGAFDRLNGRIKWIYKNENTLQITEIYEFDRLLNYNTNTNAFYPWTITDSDVKVNSILIADAQAGTISTDNVVTLIGDQVIDSLGNNVITFTSSGIVNTPTDKYLVSYLSGSSYTFTFADRSNADYVDWFQRDFVGQSFTSFFTTGFKLIGQAINKSQSNWTRVFSKTAGEVSYFFQGIWDYATTGSGTGRWSSRQYVNHTDTNYSTSSKRLKVRGHGVAMQFRVSSVEGEPFEIAGWSSFNSTNQIP